MATLDWHLSRTDGVTLVELQVSSDTRERVRIESTLDPVWPPREQGVPVAGWDDGCFEDIVTEGDTLVVGYASPAAPTEPPAELVVNESVPTEETPRNSDGPLLSDESVTARTLVRTLGEAAPPRDAVPGGAGGDVTGETSQQHSTPRVTQERTPAAAWLDAVAERLSTAERLASASTVSEVRETVDAVGSMTDVRQLATQLERDEEALRTVTHRSERLADRAESVSVPVTTLERVR